MKVWTSLAVVATLAVASVNAVTWNLKDTINGNSYMDKFDYFTDKDPTNGLVVYQNQQQAQQLNLTYAHGEDFVIRVDTTKTRAEGRPSVRLQSKANYGDSVIMYGSMLTQSPNVPHSDWLCRLACILDGDVGRVTVAYGR